MNVGGNAYFLLTRLKHRMIFLGRNLFVKKKKKKKKYRLLIICVCRLKFNLMASNQLRSRYDIGQFRPR